MASGPAPTVHPVRMPDEVPLAQSVAFGTQPKLTSLVVRLDLVWPYARPPVPYSSHCGVTRNPTRPRIVPNQSMDLVTPLEVVSNNGGDSVWPADPLMPEP